MLLADVTLSTEAVVVIGVLLSGLAAAVGTVFKLLMAAKDDLLKSYKDVAAEAVDNLEAAHKAYAQRHGKHVPEPLAAVIPEHSSPPKQKQIDTADLQTLRARLTAATLGLELPARQASVL